MALHIIGLATEPVAFRFPLSAFCIFLSALLTLCQSGAKCCRFGERGRVASFLCQIAGFPPLEKRQRTHTYFAV